MASPYKYSGEIVWVGPIEKFQSGFKKRVFVVCPNPDDQYPDTVAFELLGGKNDMTGDITENDKGCEATVEFYTQSRSWEKNGKMSWITSNRAVKVGVARKVDESGDDEQAESGVPAEQGDPEDLPF